MGNWHNGGINCTHICLGKQNHAARQVLCQCANSPLRIAACFRPSLASESWSPYPFSLYCYSPVRTTMQAVGRTQAADRPRSVWSIKQGSQGQGQEGPGGEEGRVGVVSRVYPESVPAPPDPHRRKTALSQFHAHHSILPMGICRADRHAATYMWHSSAAPAEGRRVPTQRETGRNSPRQPLTCCC